MQTKSLFSFQVPLRDRILEPSGFVTRPWMTFFNLVRTLLEPLGREEIFDLENDHAVDDIKGLRFDSTQVSQAVVDFLIQRITTGTGATELITSGTFHVVYKPIAETWDIVTMGTPGPSTSGITLTITATGQVQYTSTSITGTPFISRIVYRARTLKAKNVQYSSQGIL